MSLERSDPTAVHSPAVVSVRWRPLVLTWLACLLVLLPAVFDGFNIFDEGFVASAAMMIRRGALPIRDFYVIYGPGQYYLTATLFSLFGEDLLVSRSAHALILAALGATVAASTLALVPRRSTWACGTVAAFLMGSGIATPGSGYAAVPSVLLLIWATHCVRRWADTGHAPSLMGASALVGVAGLFRWDFGVMGFLALVASLAISGVTADRKVHIRPLMQATVPGALLMLMGFVPFIVLGGAARWLEEVPVFLLLYFKDWRNLEFVRPHLASLVQAVGAWHPYIASHDLSLLLMAGLPLLAGTAGLVVAIVRLHRKSGLARPVEVQVLVLAFITLFLYNQMRVRSGFPQGYPSFVTALPLSAYLLFAARHALGGLWQWARPVLTLACAASLLVLLATWQSDWRQSWDRSALVPPWPRATGVRTGTVPAEQQRRQDYLALLAHLRQHTQPNEPIFSGVADTSRLFVNDALLYFLVNRPSATRFIEMEPGLTNTLAGQHALIDELNALNVRTVVLLNVTANEPNNTGRSNGVHVLDKYIRQQFAESARFGVYTVMTRLPR